MLQSSVIRPPRWEIIPFNPNPKQDVYETKTKDVHVENPNLFVLGSQEGLLISCGRVSAGVVEE